MSECYCWVSQKVVKTRRVILFFKILDVILKCGTEYSGFKSVDLQKGSLKLAAGKYKIKGEVNLLSNAVKESKSSIDICLKYPKCCRIPLHAHVRNIFLSMILPI